MSTVDYFSMIINWKILVKKKKVFALAIYMPVAAYTQQIDNITSLYLRLTIPGSDLLTHLHTSVETAGSSCTKIVFTKRCIDS